MLETAWIYKREKISFPLPEIKNANAIIFINLDTLNHVIIIAYSEEVEN